LLLLCVKYKELSGYGAPAGGRKAAPKLKSLNPQGPGVAGRNASGGDAGDITVFDDKATNALVIAIEPFYGLPGLRG